MTQNKFWLDFAKIASAAVMSQTIIFATTPIFTRLYDPVTVGIAAVFMAVVFSIAPVSSFSYNQALVLANDDNEAASIAALSFLLTLAVSVILMFPFGMFPEACFSFLVSPELRNLLWLIPVNIFIKGIGTILLMESTRESSFGTQGRSRIIQTVSERVLVLGAGVMGKAEPAAIIIGRMISYFLEAASFREIFAKFIVQARSLSFHSLKAVASKYHQFPLYANWTYLLANLSAYVAVFLIAFFFNAEFTGLYVISERVLFTPLIIFGDSLKNVYYQKAVTQRDDPNQLQVFYLKIRERLLAYGIFPALLMFCFGREVFRLFLGARWETAGHIAGILCLAAFFQFISTPIMSLVNVLGKQKQFLLFTGLLLGVKFISITIGGLKGQPIMAVWLITIGGSLTYIAIHCWIDRLLSVHIWLLFIQLLKYSLIALSLLSGIVMMHYYFTGMLALILALTCATLLYYSVVVHIVENKSIVTILKQIGRMKNARKF
ncbi:MAG: oligosaccharide flippase family protein [Pseudomonadota bacterium]